VVLELEPPADLDGSGGTDVAAIPEAKRPASRRDVIDEGKTRALIVNAIVDEVMQVEGVKECKTELEVYSLSQVCVFRKREVDVLKVWTSQIRDSRTESGKSKSAGSTWSSSRIKVEIRNRLERRWVEQTTLSRVESIGILQEWANAWH